MNKEVKDVPTKDQLPPSVLRRLAAHDREVARHGRSR